MMAVDISASSSPSRNMDVFGKELRLSEADRKLLTGAGDIFLCKNLQVETHSKKGDSSEPRSLVISSTRCYILIQSPASKLETSFNFLMIQQLQCSEHKLTFHLSGESRPREFLSSRLDSVEVVSLITAQLKNVFPRTSMEVLLKLTFDPDSLRNDVIRLRGDLMSTMDRMDPSTVQSLVTSYGFLCDFFGTEYKSEVSWYLNNVYLGHGLREIKLSDFDHLTTKELLPLVSSLRHNDFFEGIIERDGKLASEVIEELSHALNSSPSIKTLVLSNCGLKPESVYRLANSLKTNPRASLTHLNLSETVLDERAVEGLGAALEALPHGLQQLRLANCKISSKGASVLAHSMKQNKQMQYSLVDFDLSSNPLGPDLLGGLSFLQDPHTIATLNLSNCNLILETVVPILIRGCTQHLSELNLARNVGKGKKVVHGHTVASGFQQFCSSSISIRSLNLSGCKLVNTIVTSLLEGLSANPNINSVHLDISCNELGSNGVQEMISAIGKTECLHRLNLSDCGLDQTMGDLITAIAQDNNKLKHLMIGKNFGGKSIVKNMVVSQLASLLRKEECNLLSLCLDDSHLKEYTPIIIDALADNTSLEKINISGNQMGSRGARCLAKALLCNCSLMEVCWDHNETPLRGFQEVAAAMEHNYTLRVMPLPLYDIGRVGKGVEDSMQTIQAHLCRNHSDERLKVEIAARHRTRLLTATQQSSVVGRELVQLEDLLQWTITHHPSHELIMEGGAIKELANNAIKLTDGLYSPRVEAEQFQIINTQVKKILEEFMEQLFVEHIKDKSVKMINKSINICNTLLSEETKEKLLNLTVSEKTSEFSQAKRDVLRHALPEIVNHVSDSNVEVAANISELVVEHTLASLENVNHKLLKLQKEERAKSHNTPDTKVSRNFTFRVQEDSSPTKRKKRVRREDKDDVDGQEINLPSSPLVSDGPVLQHLGKSRPKPARLQRGRPSKKPSTQEQTESITPPPPADAPSPNLPPSPSTTTPPPQPKIALKPSPQLMVKNKGKEETKKKELIVKETSSPKNGKSIGDDKYDKNEGTQKKTKIEASTNGGTEGVKGVKEKNTNGGTEGVKKENTNGGTEGVKKESTNGGTEGVKKESTNGGTEGVKKESTNGGTEGVKKESTNGGTEGVKKESTNGGTEGVKKESTNGGTEGIKKESINGGTQGVKEMSTNGGTQGVKKTSTNGGTQGVKKTSTNGEMEGVKEMIINDGVEGVKKETSSEEIKEESSTEGVKKESINGVTEGVKKEGSSEGVKEESNPTKEVTRVEKRDSEEEVKVEEDDVIEQSFLSEEDEEEHRLMVQEEEHNSSMDDVNNKSIAVVIPPHQPEETAMIADTTEAIDKKTDILSNLEDVLKKKHATDEATPPTDETTPPTDEVTSDEATPPIVSTEKPKETPTENDVKGSSIRSKGSKKRSVLPNIFKRNKDVETVPSSEGRDTHSGDWEVIDPIATTITATTTTTTSTDNKSHEISKKTPPAVKGRPKVKPPPPSPSLSSSSETTDSVAVAGVEGGGSKKVPLVLPSAPMSSLASVLQQGGAVKKEGEIEQSRPSKSSPSPAPKPRPSGDKVGPSPPPKVKTTREPHTPLKASPLPAPKPKPKPSIRRKTGEGDESGTKKTEESPIKNEVTLV